MKIMHHLVFPINALPSIQMVEAGIDDILYNADLKYEALRGYYEKIDADVLFYFHDAVIQAEAMGAEIHYSAKRMPAVISSAQSISVPDPEGTPRMKVNAQVLKRMEKEFPEKLRACLVYGPFTVAGQVVGEEMILRMLKDDPEGVMDILARTFQCSLRYAAYLVESGANLLWISDPLSVLIPPSQFRKYSGDFLRRLFESYRSIPTILHICGDTSQFVEEMVKTSVSGISFDNCMDLMALEDQIPDDVCIIGNVDPVEVIELGSQDDIISRTSDLISMMALKDNFVLSTGCAVPPSAPVENVGIFVETGRRSLANLKHHIPLLQEISRNVYLGNREATVQHVTSSIKVGIDPLTIIASGLTRAIRKGSAMYEAKLCFLPAILFMVDAFYKGFQALENRLELDELKNSSILIGTVKGDIHEIGKNLVRLFLEIHGHKVVDLGVDVPADTFMDTYLEYRPSIIGLSAFTTDSRKEMEKTIHSFHNKGIKDVLFVVGGAAVNNEVARSIGADGYARDAVRAVGLVEKLLKQSRVGI
ncbi:MAG: uroporphyrinogen decarboxylase family protein [Thermodesulfobacteriota bacterium]|nr:uroporphyrinogen decarboxylase family protein [Thermodesulfobacteriota bacterium]